MIEESKFMCLSLKRQFGEEPKLLKNMNNRPKSELLIWEKQFYLQKQESGNQF